MTDYLRKVLLVVIVTFFFTFFSCNQKINVEGIGIILKDTINLYKDLESINQPVLVLQFGDIVQVISSSNNENSGDFIKVVPINSKKIYYANANDIYPVKSIVKVKNKEYYVLKTGMIDISKGSYFYTEVVTSSDGKISPKNGSSISWGTQFNILFEKSKDITPPSIFLEPSNYKVREGKFLFVQSVENKELIGYVYASTIAFDAKAGVVLENTSYYSAPLNSALSLGNIDVFELITVFEENNGYYKFNCSNKKIYGKYIPVDYVSVDYNDVLFLQQFMAKLPQGINQVTEVKDETLKNDLVNMINNYLDNNKETKLREPLNRVIETLNNNFNNNSEQNSTDSDNESFED